MVVKQNNIENICDSLNNLQQYFSTNTELDSKTASLIEATLLKLERELALTTRDYKPKRKYFEPNQNH